jgi:hypothetical protein
MTKPRKPNIRKIAFQKECYAQLEQYINESEMVISHKEFILDLAALIDFLETENYIGAEYLGSIMLEKLRHFLPTWKSAARNKVPKDYQMPIVELQPDNNN